MKAMCWSWAFRCHCAANWARTSACAAVGAAPPGPPAAPADAGDGDDIMGNGKSGKGEEVDIAGAATALSTVKAAPPAFTGTGATGPTPAAAAADDDDDNDDDNACAAAPAASA